MTRILLSLFLVSLLACTPDKPAEAPTPPAEAPTTKDEAVNADATRTAAGVLEHFPSNVRSAAAWYGHTFKVGGTPVIPTAAVPEAELIKHVGKQVVVKGVWHPGTPWKPEPGDASPNPGAKPGTPRGDGIKAASLKPAP